MAKRCRYQHLKKQNAQRISRLQPFFGLIKGNLLKHIYSTVILKGLDQFLGEKLILPITPVHCGLVLEKNHRFVERVRLPDL